MKLREHFAPAILKDEKTHFSLDVRPVLSSGGEPYSCIIDVVQQLKSGNILILHAPFEPKPIMAQLTRMGYRVRSEKVEPDHWAVEIVRS